MGASQSQDDGSSSHGHSHGPGEECSHGHSHSHGGRTSSSTLVPAALTAAQLQGAPTVATSAAYLHSTHAPVTLAAQAAPATPPLKPVAAAHHDAAHSAHSVAHVAHPDFTQSTAAKPASATAATAAAGAATAAAVSHGHTTATHTEHATHVHSEPAQVGRHKQAAPTGVVSAAPASSAHAHHPTSAAATTAATAAGAGAIGAVATHHHHHHTHEQQQPQPQPAVVETLSSSSYGAVPMTGGAPSAAPVSTMTLVPTAAHPHASGVTSTAGASVPIVEHHTHVAPSSEVVRPIEMAPAVAVLPGFASEAAAGAAAPQQPAVHAGPSADRATLVSAPAPAAVTAAHIAPVSTGQVVGTTLVQTLAPSTDGTVTGIPPAATTQVTSQPTAAHATATTAVTAGTATSTTASTATTAPATTPAATTAAATAATAAAPAAAAAAAAPAAAAARAAEPGSPNRPAKVAKGLQTGLWSKLIAWCNPLLPQGVVLAWDERDVAEMVLALPHSDSFKATLQQRQLERKRRRKQAAAEQAEAAAKGIRLPAASPSASSNPTVSSPHSATQLPVPYELASVLLSLDKTLSAMRLQWVPSRVSEDTFFVTYFEAIVAAITAHVTRVESALTGKVSGPTVHDRIHAIEEKTKSAEVH